MPRKAYLNDLAIAAETLHHEGNIINVRSGTDTGEFVFSFVLNSSGDSTDVSVLVPDVSDYPERHEYHIFATDDAPQIVATALQAIPDFSGKPIPVLLSLLSRFLTEQTRTGGQDDPLEINSNDDVDMSNSQNLDGTEDDSDDEDCENEDWALDEALDHHIPSHRGQEFEDSLKWSYPDARTNFASSARADLRAVKEAGFKVGVLGSLQPNNTCYISISCRLSKLGVSEDAMAAWGVRPDDYLILLLSYKSGYRPLDFLRSLNSSAARQYLDIRTGISNSYKVLSHFEAHAAFMPLSPDIAAVENGDNKQGVGFRQSFISRPLDELFNGRLLTIIGHRLGMCLTWADAELFCNENQGKGKAHLMLHETPQEMDESPSTVLPAIATADELQEAKPKKDLSLPLIAMQFLLRHFVSAPSFCLVCHCKLNNKLEAIKPYVCDKGLCLYQYMSLGFGPSIEHELMAQPYVVDLLVSFCYSSVKACSLHTLPEGLGFLVPDPTLALNQWNASIGTGSETLIASMKLVVKNKMIKARPAKPETSRRARPQSKSYDVKLRQSTLELDFETYMYKNSPVRRGDWVVINCPGSPAWHCRIVDTSFFPRVTLGEPVVHQKLSHPHTSGTHMNNYIKTNVHPTTHPVDSRSASWQSAISHIYDQNFDDLTVAQRYQSMQLLLDLMPGVEEMRQYLMKKRGSSLAAWIDRMSPATLGLLRWIIASNRSCIMQVDRPASQVAGTQAFTSGEHRVEGVPGYLQFRFAMGAPDKEQRFVDAIQSVKEGAKYPTFFAWHGSALKNWHNIIRESLNFKDIVNGRVHGHGVYFAKEFETSAGYANVGAGSVINTYTSEANWPQSALQVSAALALVEIVNAPEQFVSRNPFYVVSQLDWIQTRYLFVKPCAQIQTVEYKLQSILAQDPMLTPSGTSLKNLVIPLTAIPRSRRSAMGMAPPLKKRARIITRAMSLLEGDSRAPASAEEDSASIITDIEDIEILSEPLNGTVTTPPLSVGTNSNSPPLTTTAFTPSTNVGLPMIPSPSYATTMASKRLQKEFRNLLAEQNTQTAGGKLAELGWYVDPEHVSRTDNLYQWVVELHSFPKELPLAIDMTARSIRSVVLEFRFPADFPMSPPFIRVVRPRFLPFHLGGGGHVTLGGSICMDLLTASGWTAACSVEAILLQIRMAIMSTDPRPARLDGVNGHVQQGNMDYGIGEAVHAFKRACRAHGWTIPSGLDDVMAFRS